MGIKADPTAKGKKSNADEPNVSLAKIANPPYMPTMRRGGNSTTNQLILGLVGKFGGGCISTVHASIVFRIRGGRLNGTVRHQPLNYFHTNMCESKLYDLVVMLSGLLLHSQLLRL